MKLFATLLLCARASALLNVVAPRAHAAQAAASRAAVRLQNEMEPEEGWCAWTGHTLPAA